MTAPTAATERNRRRRFYVDAPLQQRLIVGLSLVQVAAVLIAVYYLDGALSGVIDANLYRVHLRPGGDVQAFAAAMMKAFALLLVISASALMLADWLWSSHVNDALEDLRLLSRRTRALDLRPDPPLSENHELLRRYHHWRARERALCQALDQRLSALQRDPPRQRAAVVAELRGLRAMLAQRRARRQ